MESALKILSTSDAFLLRVTFSSTRQDGSASHIDLAHVAFDYFHGLRCCDMPHFVAQSQTPCNFNPHIAIFTGFLSTTLSDVGLQLPHRRRGQEAGF
jgi:hypothetical protein